MNRLIAALLVAGVSLGCASKSKTTTASAAPVNKMCAIMHEHPVEATEPATISWKGQTVGFCCADCIDEWNKLSSSDKDKALAAAIAAK